MEDQIIRTIDDSIKVMKDSWSKDLAEIRSLLQEWVGNLATSKPTPVEFRRFCGENPEFWISQAERYFALYGISENNKLLLASSYLDGEALDWYRWLFRNKQLVDWEHFIAKVRIRFRQKGLESVEGQLAKLRQTTTVSEYQSHFEAILLGFGESEQSDYRGKTEACKVFDEMFESEIDPKHSMDVGNTNDQVFNISSLPNVTTLLPITPIEFALKDGKSEEESDVKVLVEGSMPAVQSQLTATSLIKEAANIEQKLAPEHFCPILQHLAHRTETAHLEKIMWKHLEYIIKSRVPSLPSLINQTMTKLEIELSPHRNHIITAPEINSKTLTLRSYSEYVVSNSMTHVWDPGWQWCMYFSIFLSDFALVVATSSIFILFDKYLEKNNLNKKRKKMELFVFSCQCMSLTYEDGCHVLLDACALDPKDIETRDILLKAFKSDGDNSQVEASTLSYFSLHSTEHDLVLVPVEPFWSYFIIVGSHTLSSRLYVIYDSIAFTCPSLAGEEYILVLDEYLDVKHKALVENFTWSIVSQHDFSTTLDCEIEIWYMVLVGMNHIAPLQAIIGFQNYAQFDEIQTSVRGPVEIVERNGDEQLVKFVYDNNWSPKIYLCGLIIHLFAGRKSWYAYIVTIGDGGVLQYFESVVVADIGAIFSSMEIICMLQVLYQDRALFLYTLTTIVMLISTLVFGFLTKSLVSHLLSYHDSTKSIDREPSISKDRPLLVIAESATITFLRAMDICSCCLKDLYMHSILTGGLMLAYIGPIFGGERIASSVPNSNLEDKVLFEEGSIVVNKANTVRTYGPNLLNKTDPVRTIGPRPNLRESPRIKQPNRLSGSYIWDPGGYAGHANTVNNV